MDDLVIVSQIIQVGRGVGPDSKGFDDQRREERGDLLDIGACYCMECPRGE